MKKIICMGDILYNSESHNYNYALWFYRLFNPFITQVLGKNVMLTHKVCSNENIPFSRKYFFDLSGKYNLKECYNQYNVKEFNKEQLLYLGKFFNQDTIVLGFELYQPLCDLLTEFGCNVIDVAFHSYKLFDDLAFGFYTNNKEIYNKLLQYQVPQDKFYLYAHYWKNFLQCNKTFTDEKLENNSAVFIGQTLTDKSVEKNGKFLNITDFSDKLNEVSQKYSKIYYLPHPALGKKRKVIYDFCKTKSFIEIIPNSSTYGLLSSNKIQKIIGISTSVLYEAKYFGKEVEYLYKPLFNIDTTFDEHSYTSIYEDYWNPKFWAEILSPVCDVKTNIEDINYFKGASNKIRNIGDMYWGYAQLDPIKRIPNFEESIKRLWVKYVAPLL